MLFSVESSRGTSDFVKGVAKNNWNYKPVFFCLDSLLTRYLNGHNFTEFHLDGIFKYGDDNNLPLEAIVYSMHLLSYVAYVVDL